MSTPITMRRVKDWGQFFESAKSKTYGHKQQTYMPNKHGLGYKRILAQPNGEAIFGAWCSVCQILSRQLKPRHGYLTDNGKPDGIPWTHSDIALMIGFKEQTVEEMMVICTAPEVGWLQEVIKSKDTARIPQGDHSPSASDSPLPLPLPSPSPLSTPTPKPEPPEVTARKPRKAKAKTDSPGFDAFWATYPKKKGKADAVKAWTQTIESRPPIGQVIAAIVAQAGSNGWVRENGRYIPYPATWLRGERWADEVDIAGADPDKEANPRCRRPDEDCLPMGAKKYAEIMGGSGNERP